MAPSALDPSESNFICAIPRHNGGRRDLKSGALIGSSPVGVKGGFEGHAHEHFEFNEFRITGHMPSIRTHVAAIHDQPVIVEVE